MCVLSDHQPANHQEIELSVIGEITEGIAVNTRNTNGYCAQDIITEPEDARTHRISSESDTVIFEGNNEHCAQGIISELEDARTQRISSESDTVMFEGKNEHCAQGIISELEDARTQRISSESNTVVIEAEIHAENTDAQHMVHFEEAQDFSDAGSLITQAPQSQSIHATINALSTWVSAIQPRESWYLAGWIGDSPIDFLVDPGAVVSAISLQSYENFNMTLLAMLAMFVSQEHDNWDDLLPFMMLAYNTTVHTTTGFTPYRLVFGDECNLPGNLVHRELRADPPPGDPGTYASWVQQALYESYDEVHAQQQRATHRQKRNYDSKAVARAFPIGCWTLRYYPPARKNKLCSPWIGPYKIVRAPMEWVVGIQIDADARIVYMHMDDLKRCAPPDPEPTWPDTARGTSIVVSTRTPSTFALSDVTRSRNIPSNTSQRPGNSAHHTQSSTSGQIDVRAPTSQRLRSSAHHTKSIISGQIDVRAPTNEKDIVKIDTVPDSIMETYAVPSSTWDLQDENCILSMKSNCSIDVKGYRFFTMERLFYALQLLSLGDRKFIGQLAKYSRMDYVRKCINTRFELASRSSQDKWLDEQFQTWTQIITARILSDPVFKQALLDSAGSPLFDPEEPVYATALTSARKMYVQQKLLTWPSWITLPTRVTRGQVLA